MWLKWKHHSSFLIGACFNYTVCPSRLKFCLVPITRRLFCNNSLRLSQGCMQRKFTRFLEKSFCIRRCDQAKRSDYIQFRNVRASVKPKLNNMTNPSKAPVPIQYQYAWGKNPRDLRTVTPSISLEFGTACNPTNVSVLSKRYTNTMEIDFRNWSGQGRVVLTRLQLCPKNSLATIAFCPYIIGEIQ